MTLITTVNDRSRKLARFGALLSLTAAPAILAGCATQGTSGPGEDFETYYPIQVLSGLAGQQDAEFANPPGLQINAPAPDPRVGLAPGMFDAGEAIWNLNMLSTKPPEEAFVGSTNSDLAFTGNYAIQGNYNGIQVWDISDPANPVSTITYVCPASQSDVSVYKHLLFVSGEGFGGRLDCGKEPLGSGVSHDRLRGIRIFDISDITAPEYVANVQTCRGSHTHTVLEHPGDDENVYIYVSGAAPVRPAEELPGCSGAPPSDDPNSALFRIEVIRVPVANPAAAAIVSSPRIFEDLVAPPTHGPSPADAEQMEAQRVIVEEARARGAFVFELQGQSIVLPDQFVQPQLDSIVEAREGEGPATAADSATFREMFMSMIGGGGGGAGGPTQCHDITVYPAIGLAGGACGGYGLLLDITDPANPFRLAAVADSNFSYWHSATFSNDGSKVMFTDEWGGGGSPKCRADDPMEWGANAIFTVENGKMVFQSYYKMPAAQTALENCVAHNGSLIPIPGRDIMVQGWYQGGISLIDWTDPKNPVEIAFHDRGPFNGERFSMAGSWSVYWYNGVIVNSEISRGLDIFELVPNESLTQNEIDAANSVELTHLNSQGQPVYEWPATFALARAYLDQLERWHGMDAPRVAAARNALDSAESGSGTARRDTLRSVANALAAHATDAADSDKVARLADAVQRLADAG